MSTTPDPPDDAERPSNVLLLASPIGDGADHACGEHLRASSTVGTHATFVSCRQSPSERLAVGDRSVGDQGPTTVIDVEMPRRSATAAGGDPAGATVERVSDPTDLARLGITIHRRLTARPGTGAVLCFHSLTDLLQHADLKTVFKFVEVLTSTSERAGAVAHYHMDPDAHDEQTIRTLTAPFDAVLDLRDEGFAGR